MGSVGLGPQLPEEKKLGSGAWVGCIKRFWSRPGGRGLSRRCAWVVGALLVTSVMSSSLVFAYPACAAHAVERETFPKPLFNAYPRTVSTKDTR